MTPKQIIRAVNRLTSRDDLRIILDTVSERMALLRKREEQAKHQTAWERGKAWPIGTIVYTTNERIIAFGDEKQSIRRGEQLIVRRVMPRARAIAFDRPERPEPYWKKYLLRLDASELHYFDCQLEPPIGEAAPDKG